ncbi:GntR family transcriptional regulator [Thalassobacillus sp. CUG 92003]|uniref:GntR family transcriptional regulator n=1 Tax=Thalassobacillus sp. CUG 92003 TaxID=2736641 RepID=UPI0015E7477C|nr:GntR family transcriptional regulator [Thalassobacillus sp. CUG 92003]
MTKQRKLPLYVQIKNKLVTNIKEGVWQPGEAIPSESQLIEQYNVSRTTIRQAIQDLAQKNVLETRRGAPTRVRNEPQIELGNPGIIHHELGTDFDVKVLRAETLKEHYYASYQLQLEENEDVYLIERLRIADNKPIAFQRMFVPLPIGEKVTTFSAEAFDIFPKLGEHNIHHTNIRELVSASNATQYEADLLGIIPGGALIDIERTTLGIDSQPIEYSRTRYLPEFFHYRVEIGK